MSYQVKWNDGAVRVFDVEERIVAERMARAYPNLVTSFEKVTSPSPVAFTPADFEEPPTDNRMIEVGKAKGTRKRKA